MKNKILVKEFLYCLVVIILAMGWTGLAQANPVRSGHPRLLITPERLSELSALAAKNDSTWMAFKSNPLNNGLSRIDGAGYMGGQWKNSSNEYALGYLVMKDLNPTLAAQYAEKAIVYLKALVRDMNTVGDGLGSGINSVKRDGWFATRTLGTGAAIAYDWLYDYPGFTQALKDEVKTQLELWIYGAWDPKVNTVQWSVNNAGNNYYWGHMTATIDAAYALYGDSTIAQERIDFARNKFETQARPYLATKVAGGDWLEGTNYNSSHYIFDFLAPVKTATGEDVFSDPNFTFPREAVLFWLYANVPTLGNGVYPGGDQSQGTHPGDFVAANFLKMASGYLTGAEAAYAKYFADNAIVSSPYAVSTFNKFIYNIPSLTAQDYRQVLPLNYKTEGTGWVNSRSSWDQNGTSVFFVDGRKEESHQHWVNNSFMLYKNGWQTASTHLYDWNSMSTGDYNNFLIAGIKQFSGVGEPPTSKIEKYETTSDYTYIQGQAASSYGKAGDDRFTLPNAATKWSLEGPYQPKGAMLSGGSLPAGTYYYKYAYRGNVHSSNPSYFYNGETLPSLESPAVMVSPGNQRIQLDLGPLPPGASGYAVYRTEVDGAPGSELFLAYTTSRNYLDDGSVALGTAGPKVANSATGAKAQLLTNYSRNIIHLKPDYIVVLDRISKTNPMFNAESFIQTHNEPVISGDQFTSQEGTGKLFLKILLPQQFEISKSYRIPSSGSSKPSWTTEINPIEVVSDHLFFNVFYAADASISEMPVTTLIDAATMAGALIQDSLNPRITLFSKVNTPQSSVTYGVSYTGNGKHLLVDMQPGAYDVYKDGSLILSNITASGEGALSFESQGGLSFQVVRTGETPSPPLPPSDTTPPSVPTNLIATAISSSQINLSWSASTDNVGVVGYKIYRNGTQIGTSATTNYSDFGLSPSTGYSYAISAYDAAGNGSNATSPVSATTLAPPDTTAPAVSLFSPTSGSTVSGTINVSANASDNVGVVGVQFKLDGSNLGSEDPTSPYSVSWDTASSANGSHTLTAVARDAAGNIGTSPSVIVTVSNAVSPPLVQTLSVSISASPNSGNSPLNSTITASVSGTATGNVNYTFYCDRTDSGTNITNPYDGKYDRETNVSKSHVCAYSSPGVFTAKVIAERGAASSTEARIGVNVSSPPAPAPAPAPSGGGYAPPPVSPVFTSISASNVGDTSAIITVQTVSPTSVQIEYGTTINYGQSTAVTPLLAINLVKLVGLAPNSVYHAQANAFVNWVTVRSSDIVFTTLPKGAGAAGTAPGAVAPGATPAITPAPAPTAPPSSVSLVSFTRTLSLGAEGEEVRGLQTILLNQGFYPEGVVSGYFGPVTQSAVSRFQAAYGIPQTTVVGPLTRAELNKIAGVAPIVRQTPAAAEPSLPSASSSPTVVLFTRSLSLGSRGDDVKRLQTILSKQGVYPEGVVSGYFGNLTRKAVRRFQEKYGIVSGGSEQTTGYGAVGPRTRQKMNEVGGR